MQAAFATTGQLPTFSKSLNPSLSRCSPTSTHITARRARFSASLSSPFPLPDLFSFPNVVFLSSTASSDFRPELVGSLLWTAGLYLGFSQSKRWGSMVFDAQAKLLRSFQLPELAVEVLVLPTHSLPFLATGFGIDAVLRHANGGSAVWAIAAGLSVASYGGIYELARSSVTPKKLSEEDQRRYDLFDDFARRKLRACGMCHLIDIKEAVRGDPKARSLTYLSDESLRRFVRNRFPKAKRSPNGYYRGLSLLDLSEAARQSAQYGSFEEG